MNLIRKILYYFLFPFLYVYYWVKCVVFKKHKIIKGCIRDSNYKRRDVCEHCREVIFVYDKIGYDMMWHQIESLSETKESIGRKNIYLYSNC